MMGKLRRIMPGRERAGKHEIQSMARDNAFAALALSRIRLGLSDLFIIYQVLERQHDTGVLLPALLHSCKPLLCVGFFCHSLFVCLSSRVSSPLPSSIIVQLWPPYLVTDIFLDKHPPAFFPSLHPSKALDHTRRT